MRPRRLSRAVLLAGALSIPAAAPAAAQTATIASAGVAKKRLQVRAGQRAMVVGSTAPAAADARRLAADPTQRALAHARP